MNSRQRRKIRRELLNFDLPNDHENDNIPRMAGRMPIRIPKHRRQAQPHAMKIETSREWFRSRAPMEEGQEIGAGVLADVARYATAYRLRLSHYLWPRDSYTKWQSSPDFTTAIKKAKQLGITATVESHNDKNQTPPPRA